MADKWKIGLVEPYFLFCVRVSSVENKVIVKMGRRVSLSHKFVVCTTRTGRKFVIFIYRNLLRAVGADVSATSGFFTCFYNVIHIHLLYCLTCCQHFYCVWL